jgi:hypothetical protein
MSVKMVRVSFTVPPSFHENLSYLAHRTGVSKSALLVEMLSTPLADMRALVETVPDNPNPDDMVRARGKSNELVTRRVASYRKLEGDLFDDRNR